MITSTKLRSMISKVTKALGSLNFNFGSENWITGVIEGGELNISPSPTDIEVLPGSGAIIDSYVFPRKQPTIISLSWPQLNEALAAQVTPNFILFTIVDSGTKVGAPIEGTNLGVLKQYVGPGVPTPEETRDEIYLGFAEWTGLIWKEVSSPNVINNTAHTLAEYISRVGQITNIIGGGIVSEAASHMLDQSAGVIWERNRNFINNPKDPHREPFAERLAFSWQYTNRDFSDVGILTNTIDATQWDDAGTVSPIGGSTNSTTIQELYVTPGDNFWIVWGQEVYPTFAAAIANINRPKQIPFLLTRSLLLGHIITEKGKTDWDLDESIFRPFTGGGNGSAGTPFVPETFSGTLSTGYVPDPGILALGRLLVDDANWDYRAKFIPYVQGQVYTPQQTVSVDGFLSTANTITTDYPIPQPVGNEISIYRGTNPLTSLSAKQVMFGNRYTASVETFEILSYEIYAIAGNHYSIFSVLDPLGAAIVTPLFSYVAPSTGWVVIHSVPIIVASGEVVDLICIADEPDPTPAQFTGDWDYVRSNNTILPLTGRITQANKVPGVLLVSYTDDIGGDRTTELQALVPGDRVHTTSTDWSIQYTIDLGTYIEIGVAPAMQSSPDGVQAFGFETVVATPITYIKDVDYWLTSSFSVQGLFVANAGYDSIVLDNSAYGVNVNVIEVVQSPDWDIQVYPEGAGSSSGSSGTVTLPVLAARISVGL